MNTMYEIDVERHREDPDYPSVEEAVQYVNRILDGSDDKTGKKLGSKVLELVSSGQKLSHPLIIFGNKIRVSHTEPNLHGFNIQARNTPFNQGLLEGLGINDDYQPTDFIGYKQYTILGKQVTAEPLFDPMNDLTAIEEEGLLRRMRTTIVDEHGVKKPIKLPSGFRIIPQFALRISFPGMVEEV